MASDTTYDSCLPILQDASVEEEDKTDKLVDLIRDSTGLSGKALDDAALDVLWRYRNASSSKTASPPFRHTVLKRNSPAPWQASRTGTPAASSPRSGAASPAPSTLSNRPGLFRARSAQQSPFSSPRQSPRLAHATLHPSLSPNPSHSELSDKVSTQDVLSDYGSENTEWFYDDMMSSASSSYLGEPGAAGEWLPNVADMSPYDMLRAVFQGKKSDDEIEGILAANNYDLNAALLASAEEQGLAPAPLDQSQVQKDRTFLVGKSLSSGSRPSTPSGQGKSNIVCRYWLQYGQCLRADCKYRHDASNHICKYWLEGRCFAGDFCAYSHDPSTLMGNLSLNESSSASTPPLDPVQIQDYSSFPTLQGNMQQGDMNANQFNDSNLAAASFIPRTGLAPDFIPNRSHSRPGSRHRSPASNPQFSNDDGDGFPSLGSAYSRGGKKHHGKRGHGHGHREKENAPGSLADVVRMSPSSNPAASPRRSLRARANYAGSRDGVAAQAIPAPQHVPWLETGDSANQDYMKARQEAIRHGGARNKFLQSAAQAWNRNDVRAAKALSLRGQSENDLMREAHREAARHLYEKRNATNRVGGETYIDLHGLHPAEAVSYLDAGLKNQRSTSAVQRRDPNDSGTIGPVPSILYVIVGSGHHSRGGKDKVGKAIRQYLNDCKYVFREFSVSGERGGGGHGGILGIDSSTGIKWPGQHRPRDAVSDDGEVHRPEPVQQGKVQILKAEDEASSES